MKKSIKICLWFSLIMCIIGFSIVGVSIALGATWKIPYMINKTNLNIFDSKNKVIDKTYETWYSDDNGDIDVDSNVTKIVMDIGYGEITIKEGDKFQFSAHNTNDNFKYKVENNGTLKIENKNKKDNRWFSINFWNGTPEREKIEIEMTIPSGSDLEKLDIDIGSGNVYIYDMKSDSFNIDSGVGDITIENSTADDIRINTGVGDVYLLLNGSRSDYSYKLMSGVGKVSLDGDTMTHAIGSQYKQNNKSEKEVDVESGVGKITVELVEN